MKLQLDGESYVTQEEVTFTWDVDLPNHISLTLIDRSQALKQIWI